MKADNALILILIGLFSLVANVIGYHHPISEAWPGMVIIIVLTLISMGIAKICPIKLPVVFFVTLIASLSTIPANPFGAKLAEIMSKVDVMCLATPLMAYVGFSMGKDILKFKKIGWRMIIVAFVTFTGTFVLASTIAEIVLSLKGII